MSAVVYAGPSQFVAVGLLGQGAALLSIVLAAFIVNLRYILYATSLGPYFRDRSTLRLSVLAYGLVDAAYRAVHLRLPPPSPPAAEGSVLPGRHASHVRGVGAHGDGRGGPSLPPSP